jgi:hypothetical protein
MPILLCVQELGIPTANVDADALRHSLAEAVTGIYCGWASIGNSSQVRMGPAVKSSIHRLLGCQQCPWMGVSLCEAFVSKHCAYMHLLATLLAPNGAGSGRSCQSSLLNLMVCDLSVLLALTAHLWPNTGATDSF